MTAQANDWLAMSDELLKIKAEAYDEGLQDAKKALENDYNNLQNEADKIMTLRTQWDQVVNIARKAYSDNTDKLMEMETQRAGDLPYWDEENHLSVPVNNEIFVEELRRLVTMGRDFETLLKGCQENEIVKTQWDRMMVALRMTK